MTIKLPPNPWTAGAQQGACVARTEAGEELVVQLEAAYPQGNGQKRAKLEHQFIARFCDHCPIKKFCGEYGRDEEFGIWGGRTEGQRASDRKMREFLKTF